MASALNSRGSTWKWRKIRAAVLARDGYRCHYCGKPATCVDHVTPRARGGTDAWSNLVASCKPCNAKKGSDLALTLRQETTDRPRGLELTDIGPLGRPVSP